MIDHVGLLCDNDSPATWPSHVPRQESTGGGADLVSVVLAGALRPDADMPRAQPHIPRVR